MIIPLASNKLEREEEEDEGEKEEGKEFNQKDPRVYTEANFTCEFDGLGRVKGIKFRLNDFSSSNYAQTSFSRHNGHPERLNGFSIEKASPRRETLRDENVEIVREYDEFAQLSHVWYHFNNHQVYHLEMLRDEASRRLHVWRRKVGSSSTRVFENLYDVDGKLTEVLVGGQSAWKLAYDADGSVNQVSYYRNVKQILTDQRGCVKKAEGVEYRFDKDGFLCRKGKHLFEFDSLSRLRRAFQPGSFDVR